MRYSVYLRSDAENGLHYIFEYLKAKGDIPANATEIGEYRAQCITYAIFSCIGRLSGSDATFDKVVNHGEAT